MTGVFGRAAPEYEMWGLAVYPLGGGKVPAVKRPGTFRPSTWHRLPQELLDAPGVGMWCGERNRITVVDFDTHDTRIVDEWIERAGDTPLKVETASGKLHLWYRHNGEARQVRPLGPDKPLDVLGCGNVVLPPSQSGAASYRFVLGGLDALREVPAINPAALAFSSLRRAEMREGDGRNRALWEAGMRWAAEARPDNAAIIETVVLRLNDDFAEPLPHREAMTVANSVWLYNGGDPNRHNTFGRARVIELRPDDMDRINDADAFFLWTLLQREHRGLRDEFAIAVVAITNRLPWSDHRITRRCVNHLIAVGLLNEIEPPRTRQAGRYAFAARMPQAA